MNYSNCSLRLRRLPAPLRQEEPTVVSVETDRRGTHMRVRKVSTLRAKLQRAAAALLFVAATAGAQTFNYTANSPSLDIWSYPFATSGTRSTASTFGSFDAPGSFDNRDAQFITGFDTAGIVPSGLPASNYIITSAKLTLSIDFSGADTVVWDGTYDPISTYSVNGIPQGDDPGRSIELYGAAYRNGVTRANLAEDTLFIPAGNVAAEGVRSVFPSDYQGGIARDVSNNFDLGFNTQPFAIGQVAPEDLNGDGTMKADADVVFTLNLLDPDVVAFLQQSLSEGRLHFITSSMAEAAQPPSPLTYPIFSTKEAGPLGDAPRFELAVTVVPEPTASSLCILAAAFAACWRNRRQFREVAE